MKAKLSILFLIPAVWLLYSCNSSRHLKSNEYMLTKNTVKVTDRKDDAFADLYYFVRPIPNRKFIDVFPVKTWIYASFQPTMDSLSGEVIKDTKFRKWMRAKGEAPVLLDTSRIDYSVNQLKIEMSQMGYFNAIVVPKIQYREKRKTASVIYTIQAGNPYFIGNIKYDIDIPQYKRIILQDTVNSNVKVNQQYNEDELIGEKNRIINSVRDKGFYYVPDEIVYFVVDTFQKPLNAKGYKTVDLEIKVDMSRVTNASAVEKMTCKYSFNNIYIYTNYDPTLNYNIDMDTVTFYRSKKDLTRYFFITPKSQAKVRRNGQYVVKRDYRYRTLTDIMYTKRDIPFSRYDVNRSSKRISDLKNFNYTNIEFDEVEVKFDSINKKGYLNTIYKLSRNKIHSFATEVDVRSDKANLSLTYSNKNIFKGAEYLNINGYFGMDILFKKTDKLILYSNNAEAGGELSIAFPRLFIFRKTQNIESLRYSTRIKFGGHWQRAASLYQRAIINVGIVYDWTPNYRVNHQVSPIDISIVKIDKYEGFDDVISRYSLAFRKKYEENVLVALKYIFNYNYMSENKRHNLSLRLRLESSGLTVSGVNALLSHSVSETSAWKFFGLNYATYELAEIDLRYRYVIDKKNSIASRFNFGIGIPLINSSVLPFEKSFYLGGANSMRAWQFRTLGPGSFYSEVRNERNGDVKLEMNLEYRGPIYKFIKFGVFTDVGNIWLAKKDTGMLHAEFNFNRFYKELAWAAGAGLRLDFSFFIIRLDVAFPIYDPNELAGSRWINKADLKKLYIPLAIGYAF